MDSAPHRARPNKARRTALKAGEEPRNEIEVAYAEGLRRGQLGSVYRPEERSSQRQTGDEPRDRWSERSRRDERRRRTPSPRHRRGESRERRSRYSDSRDRRRSPSPSPRRDDRWRRGEQSRRSESRYRRRSPSPSPRRDDRWRRGEQSRRSESRYRRRSPSPSHRRDERLETGRRRYSRSPRRSRSPLRRYRSPSPLRARRDERSYANRRQRTPPPSTPLRRANDRRDEERRSRSPRQNYESNERSKRSPRPMAPPPRPAPKEPEPFVVETPAPRQEGPIQTPVSLVADKVTGLVADEVMVEGGAEQELAGEGETQQSAMASGSELGDGELPLENELAENDDNFGLDFGTDDGILDPPAGSVVVKQSVGPTELGIFAEQEAMSVAESATIMERITHDNVMLSDALASYVQTLLDRLETVDSEYLMIGGVEIRVDDLLSLYWVPGLDTAAWFTEPVFTSLLSAELANVTGVYFFRESHAWLTSDNVDEKKFRDNRRRVIAERTMPLFGGWPMYDLPDDAKTILFPFNPSRNHWVGIEVRIQDPPEVRVYNPWANKGGSFKAASEDMPLLLQLASVPETSPLHKFDWSAVKVVEGDCPQQSDVNVDCGSWVIYVLVRLAHGQPLASLNLGTDQLRHEFGQWLRLQCATALFHNCMGWAQTLDAFSLGELFDKQPTLQGLSEWYRESPQSAAKEKRDAHVAELAASRPTKAGPAGPPAADDVLEAILEAGDDDGEGSKHGPWRIALGQDAGRVRSIIIVVRFSSVPRWYKRESSVEQTQQEIVRIAVDAFRKYKLYAINDTRTESDVVVHAAFCVQTRYMPAIAPTIASTEAPSREDTNDGGVEICCPLCEYKVALTGARSLTVAGESISRHLTAHHMQVDLKALITQYGNIWRANCTKCSRQFEGEVLSVTKDRLLKHMGRCVLPQWMNDQGLSARVTGLGKEDIAWPAMSWGDIGPIVNGQNEDSLPTCPYCGVYLAKPKRHVQAHHVDDAIPTGMHLCDHILSGTDGTYGDLAPDIKASCESLKVNGGWYCAWSDAGAEHCKRKTAFRTKAQRTTHYQEQHSSHFWPYISGTRCAWVTASKMELAEHKAEAHGLINLSSQPTRRARAITQDGQQAALSSINVRRARRFTAAITQSVRQADEHEPILLSVGTDGFTCNGTLMRDYLENFCVSFNFVVYVRKLGQLREEFLQAVDETWWGNYDSRVLLQSLTDITTAPANYQDLIQVWDRLQTMKNEESALRVTRNQRPPADEQIEHDVDEENDGGLFVS